MFLWIHLIFAIVLIALVIASLAKKQGYKPYMMMSRVSYLVFIITGVILFFKAFDRNPLFALLKVLIAILLIGLIEMTYAAKAKDQLTKGMIYSLVCGFVLVIIVGFIVAQGRPF